TSGRGVVWSMRGHHSGRRAVGAILRYARRVQRWLLSLALVAGCGGGSAAGTGAGDGGAHGGGADKAGRPARTAATGPLTEKECVVLADHMLDVALAEQRATLPPEKVPTAEKVAEVRGR